MTNTFQDTEKQEIFDKIAVQYFNKNFGSMSKADFELLLFSEFVEHRRKMHEPVDDYSLSRILGITQTRVRSLMERKGLKYPNPDETESSWKEQFAIAVNGAKYDPTDHYIKMIIQDVTVMNEVKHFIETKGWYDETSLNRKLLRIQLDCFVEICTDEADWENVFTPEAKKKIKELKNKDNELIAFLDDFKKEGFMKLLTSASKELLLLVLPELRFTGLAETVIKGLVRVIRKA